MTTPRTDWLSGAVTGVFGGLLAVYFPIVGIAAVLLFAAIAARRPSRLVAWSGLLVGFGGGWAALLLRAISSCAEFDAAPGRACAAPDVTGWLFAAAALLASGVTLLLVAGRRS
jgi:hypothetical protein